MNGYIGLLCDRTSVVDYYEQQKKVLISCSVTVVGSSGIVTLVTSKSLRDFCTVRSGGCRQWTPISCTSVQMDTDNGNFRWNGRRRFPDVVSVTVIVYS